MIYDLYPYDSDIEISWRSTDLIGVKPLKGVRLENSIDNFLLTEEAVASGRAPATNGTVLVGYFLSYYAFWDYNDLLNQVSAKYFESWNSRPEGVKRLMAAHSYTDLLEGSYPVDISYTLPGATKPNYTTQISIKF